MGIGNSRLSPCGGVHNHTMTDFIVSARQLNRDISRFIFSTLERQLFDVDNYIWYQIDQNYMLHATIYQK